MNSAGKSTAAHGGLTPSSSRWTPAKEQINILESLYKQGIRTPTADQIQHITNRLKNYGHIEGKNVFYWFQNHKARQRQKQKQEVATAYFNTLFHHSPPPRPPPPPPPRPPVLFSPPSGRRLVTIQPSPDFGYRAMNMATQKIPLPGSGSVKRKSVDREMCMNINNGVGLGLGRNELIRGRVQHQLQQVGGGQIMNNMNRVSDDIGTLCLFPLEPTGGKAAATAVETVVVDVEDEEKEGGRFFDFLSQGKERKLS